jgi:transposase InsO family protein
VLGLPAHRRRACEARGHGLARDGGESAAPRRDRSGAVQVRADLARVPPRTGIRGEVLACDFLCVDTLGLRTVYVFFFIERDTRRVHLAGVTRNPSGGWVAQQAPNLAIGGVLEGLKILIRDRDSKFTAAFDAVFASEGVRVIRTPVRTPVANAYAERFVRTLRRECLDWLLI